MPELRAFYRRDFYPWDADNRELISTMLTQLAPYLVR